MHIHWFNPENDIALAAGLQNFTPPKAAARIHDSGALLPLWYASAGDKVLCYGVNAGWLEVMQRDFGIDVDVFDHHPDSDTIPDPWGWSDYARHFFLSEGFLPESMPSEASIARMRQLSHRRTSSLLARRLAELMPALQLGEAATEAADIDTVSSILADGRAHYLKQPWSSSGRGVLSTADVGADRALKFADDSIRRQGSVMVEPAYDRVIDFALLYECTSGICRDIGTSVFTTDERGAYTGNVLASEGERAAMIGRYIGADMLASVSETLRSIIEVEIAPDYDGVVGVDMMTDSSGAVAIAEVNLRKTMGYVAARFADMYLAPGAIGTFRVCPVQPSVVLQPAYDLDGCRIVHGTLPLTPPGYPFDFVVEVR